MKEVEVECGFRKWSIKINEDCGVVITYNYHPIYGQITLHDMSVEECEKIGQMFLGMALLGKADK